MRRQPAAGAVAVQPLPGGSGALRPREPRVRPRRPLLPSAGWGWGWG